MTSAQLGSRIGIAQSSVVDLENAEARGAIQISSLRRAAVAMDCTLVICTRAKTCLEAFLQKQSRMVAREHLESVEHTMMLEGQSVPSDRAEEMLDSYIQNKLKLRMIW